MRVKRKPTGAEINGARPRCWRCKGRRLTYHYVLERLVPCTSCNSSGPQPKSIACEEVREAA